MHEINVQAALLRQKLFALKGEFTDLAARVNVARCDDLDPLLDAQQQIDRARQSLVAAYDELGDVFVDAYRDTKDQAFAIR